MDYLGESLFVSDYTASAASHINRACSMIFLTFRLSWHFFSFFVGIIIYYRFVSNAQWTAMWKMINCFNAD